MEEFGYLGSIIHQIGGKDRLINKVQKTIKVFAILTNPGTLDCTHLTLKYTVLILMWNQPVLLMQDIEDYKKYHKTIAHLCD